MAAGSTKEELLIQTSRNRWADLRKIRRQLFLHCLMFSSTIEMIAAIFLPRRVTSTGSLPNAARLIVSERLSRSVFVLMEGRTLGEPKSSRCTAIP